MATTTQLDESLAERDEVLFPNTSLIDTEPLYKNFTSIQNLLRCNQEQKQFNRVCSNYFSKTIDGHLFNLIQIVEEIGYNPQSPFLHSSSDDQNNQALVNLIFDLGGAHGPLVPIRRLHLDSEYFSRCYFEKYARSASSNRLARLIEKKTTQKSDDNQSNIYFHLPFNTFKQMDEKHFQNDVLRMYGFDDLETNSSVSSRRSSIDELNTTPTRQLTPVPLETIDNVKPKQQITIREYYPSKDMSSLVVNRSISSSSSQQTIEDNDYEQFISNHPELYNDPNPDVVTKPNPDQVTYQQNISVRYLVPPTPPPPGPLIIREILPPRAPTPPPLVIKQQDPAPPTPPPLILREAPPTPPPYQEAKVITKMLPQEPSPPPRVIIEQKPPLPPKPQSIIIEKWLPYKPPPPREVIYERVIETPVVSQFQPGGVSTDRQRRHSADFHAQSSTRLQIPVHIERQNSIDHLNTAQSSTFDQFAWLTQQQLDRMQAHHRWIANQHQQHMYMFKTLTTPALIVHHPPVTRSITSYAQREEFLYKPTLITYA